MEGHYLTPKDAGNYCGYSVRTFRRLAKEYQLPRYGPGQARFSTEDLDRWMRNPFEFVRTKPSIRRGKKSFTPVVL